MWVVQWQGTGTVPPGMSEHADQAEAEAAKARKVKAGSPYVVCFEIDEEETA
jgi:hypothetical protein